LGRNGAEKISNTRPDASGFLKKFGRPKPAKIRHLNPHGKHRKELKDLFAGCKSGLVFVTAFASRDSMRSFLTQISWETEVWVAEDPDHLIHFDGERFLGPYPDAQPKGT
jgi:hypothetical protein